MQTTSSPTSATPSSDYKAVPFFGWSLLAVLFVAGSFLSREISTEDTQNIFYDYDFAVTTIVWYAALVGLTFALAIPYPRTPRALGLNPFRWRWVGIAFGFIIGVLIAQRPPGAAPPRRPRAGSCHPTSGSRSTRGRFS